MTLPSPELQKIFKDHGVDLETIPHNRGTDHRATSTVSKPTRKPTQQPVKQARVMSLLYYFLQEERLQSKEKVLLLLVADAHLRVTACQISVRLLRQYLGHSRSTVFRVLKRLEPDWAFRDRRPGKTSLLKPGPLLLRYIRRADGKGYKKWASNRTGQTPWKNQARCSTGMSRAFQHI